ncbi:MAG: UDP-2,3-diacylglucosamine hydrolase [Legionellaceae bacterium]
MYTLFISDLHLNPFQPEITELFLQFLKNQALAADALYILGDLFETWIGDDENSPFNQTIKQELRQLSATGTHIYILPGNRDFLLGKRFMEETGCHYLSDPSLINLYGVSTLLLHGDLLCTDDIPYLKFRKWVRKPWIQSLFLKLRLSIREKLANKIRKKSKKYLHTVTPSIVDVTKEGIIHYIEQYSVTQLIHGHTHNPGVHFFKYKNDLITRYTLSDWDEKGNVLICYSTGEKQLVNITQALARPML